MVKKYMQIEHIKAVIWGDESNTIIIAVHGDQSNKEDVPIQILAENAAQRGMQVISFDLPENGERKDEKTPCTVQNCVKELNMIMDYVKKQWKHVCLFANSMGAYFGMMAYQNENIEKAWFLSPLVDMQRMIENMMKWFQVSEERLKAEKEIETPIGKTLYWDYYYYVKEHSIVQWNVSTYILRGTKDTTCEEDTIQTFIHNYSNVEMQLVEDSEHYFHTEYDLEMLKKWFCSSME
ncbi:MAG: alpha/beta hydrolase [Hespellia sp.]|nr:alpha/beta hydrolase [Hespellia sp.]